MVQIQRLAEMFPGDGCIGYGMRPADGNAGAGPGVRGYGVGGCVQSWLRGGFWGRWTADYTAVDEGDGGRRGGEESSYFSSGARRDGVQI